MGFSHINHYKPSISGYLHLWKHAFPEKILRWSPRFFSLGPRLALHFACHVDRPQGLGSSDGQSLRIANGKYLLRRKTANKSEKSMSVNLQMVDDVPLSGEITKRSLRDKKITIRWSEEFGHFGKVAPIQVQSFQWSRSEVVIKLIHPESMYYTILSDIFFWLCPHSIQRIPHDIPSVSPFIFQQIRQASPIFPAFSMVSVGLDCPRIAELATPSRTAKLSVGFLWSASQSFLICDSKRMQKGYYVHMFGSVWNQGILEYQKNGHQRIGNMMIIHGNRGYTIFKQTRILGASVW